MSSHALLVGISHFDDPKLAKLNSPKSDVEAFGNLLKDPARGGFDDVKVSIDQDLLTIRDQLSALFDGRSAEDMVLLYYTGHGIVAKGQRLYLATGQSSFDRPQARSLSTNEIRDLMEQSRAGKLVVILDCCHSGVFAEGAKGADAPAMTENTFGNVDGAEGQYVLTATSGLQYAYDGTGALREETKGPMLSRFTHWLVDGLKGEASPFDEQITLDTLYQYLCKRARTEQTGMTPQRFVKRGSGEIVIAKNPTAKPLALPDDLVAKLDATDWKVRKAAVEELGKVAKQPRMGPLAKKAVLDRISDERDVDVREAMTNLLQRLGAPAGDDNTGDRFADVVSLERPPAPEPKRARRKPAPEPEFESEPESEPLRPRPVPPQPAPAPPMPLPKLDDWQTKVLVKSGVVTPALTGPNGVALLLELQRRAEGLRRSSHMHIGYIIGVIVVGLAAIGQAADANSDAAALSLFVMIGFGIAGLLNRKRLPAGASADADIQRIVQAVPLIEARWGWGWGWAKREYEANLYHRACWWMVIGGVVSFLAMATQF
jgi:hypothetical protein